MFRPSKELCECGNQKSQIAKQCLACRRKRTLVQCEHCGSGFECRPGKLKRTCSRQCADRLRAAASSATQCRKVAIVCEYCGAERLVSPSYQERRFCSVDCKNQHLRGERHHSWRGGISAEHDLFYTSAEWKRACSIVWARDKRTCQRCGEVHKRPARMFEVHHIGSWAKFPELRLVTENLVLLCRCCHLFVHSRANTDRQFVRLKH